MPYGYTGKTLLVDLSNRKIDVEDNDETYYRNYLGGRGVGYRYLLEQVPAGVDPLAPDNILVLAAGVGTGVVFPLSAHIAVLSGRSLARTAGALDAVDHLGAALGAFLTGVILVPVLGRTTTCLLLALACALIGVMNLFFRNGKDSTCQ